MKVVDVHIVELGEAQRSPISCSWFRDTFTVSSNEASDLVKVLFWKSGGNCFLLYAVPAIPLRRRPHSL